MNIAQKNMIRAELHKHSINTRGMSNDELQSKYDALSTGVEESPKTLPAKPARTVAPKLEAVEVVEPVHTVEEQPANDAAKMAKIAELIDSLTPKPQEAPAFDEEQLIRLIKEHGTQTLNVASHKVPEGVKIEGAHKALDKLVRLISVDIKPYLVGPAGSGKTTLAVQVAQSLGLDFYSHGAISAPYEVIGHYDANGNYLAPALRQAFEFGGLVLLDEVDACSSRALVTINQLLANGIYTFPDGPVKRHPDFRVIAAANTRGKGATRQYNGRNPLDDASLDRFVEFELGYDAALEARVAHAHHVAHGGTDTVKVDQWIARVIQARTLADSLKVEALITPRASEFGARMLATGFSFDELDTMVLFKGVSADGVKQIKRGLEA